MLKKRYENRKSEKNHNNRLHFLVAIVFLLCMLMVYKLFDLQIRKHDLYTALALDQHQVFNQIEPERGRIFMQDISEDKKIDHYPIAINKEFALVYAVPKKIKNASEVADQLYEIFDRELVEKEVEELLEEDDFFNISTSTNFVSAQGELKLMEAAERNEREEFKKIKTELEIEWRREKIIGEYLKKLEKKNDPYEPLKRKVDKDKLAQVLAMNVPGIDYIMEKHRYYPEGDIVGHITGFVGFDADGQKGRYGLEGFFNDELTGKFGSIKAERSADGGLIIVKDRELNSSKDGSNLILTINRSIQYAACKKLEEAVEKYGADGGTVIAMNPQTGGILAMCSNPKYDPNTYNEVESGDVYNNSAIFDGYEPGSIFKVITMASGLDQEKITPDTPFDDKGFVMVEGWNKPIKNSDYETKGGHGLVDMNTVLEESLNTGTIFAMNKVGPEVFAGYVKKFGFGEKTGIELETEGITNIVNLTRNTIRPVEAATASFGQGITATPLQMVVAYSAIANGGILMKPYLVDEIVSPSGESSKTVPSQIRRVVSERAAMLLSGMMVNVVDGGHAIMAGVKGYYVAGKTGTAQVADVGGYGDKTIHTFVGFAPVDEPKFVMLVKLDNPANVRFSASSAAPLFGDLAEYMLNYYQIPKER